MFILSVSNVRVARHFRTAKAAIIFATDNFEGLEFSAYGDKNCTQPLVKDGDLYAKGYTPGAVDNVLVIEEASASGSKTISVNDRDLPALKPVQVSGKASKVA